MLLAVAKLRGDGPCDMETCTPKLNFAKVWCKNIPTYQRHSGNRHLQDMTNAADNMVVACNSRLVGPWMGLESPPNMRPKQLT